VNYVCHLCPKRFKTEQYLKMHMVIHSDDKPFQCELCDSSFNRKDKLKRHLLIHDPVKRYKCPLQSRTGNPASPNVSFVQPPCLTQDLLE